MRNSILAGMMMRIRGPVIASYAASGAIGGTSFNVTMPSGIVTGDLLLVFTASSLSSTTHPLIAFTAGWSNPYLSGGSNFYQVFQKIADGTENSVTQTWSKTGGMNPTSFFVVRISGANVTTPVESASSYATATTTASTIAAPTRSEEHTSELQSPMY